MNFYNYFLSEKIIITIIKCIPINQDIHFLILEKLVRDIIEEEFFSIHDEFIAADIYWLILIKVINSFQEYNEILYSFFLSQVSNHFYKGYSTNLRYSFAYIMKSSC